MKVFLFLGGWLGLMAASAADFSPRSMAYVLQADRLAKSREGVVRRLAECRRDVVVLDTHYDGSERGGWTPEELSAIRQGQPGRRVLAYVSIGEAEDYRSYWQKNWDVDRNGRPDAGAPRFLLEENPNWQGNYRVRYWLPEWQQIMLKVVDRVVEQGFDGLYLDIVDAYESFEYDAATKDWLENRVNTETGQTYRQDMIAWVERVAQRARQRKAEFLIVPQNGEGLLAQPSYRRLISGIGVEDLLVEGSHLRREQAWQGRLKFLKTLQNDGKPVLLIDYPQSQRVHASAFEWAGKLGMTLLLTDRELTTLGEVR